jgi:hypothetical protein
MDAMDDSIKEFLKQNTPKIRSLNPQEPTAEDYYLFLNDHLKGAALDRMLSHLRTSAEARALVQESRKMISNLSQSKTIKVPSAAVTRAKALSAKNVLLNCPHCGQGITPFKKPLSQQSWINGGWLLLSVAAFAASFAIPRYFYQCLAVMVLAGMKWIVLSRNTKTQILIYKALADNNQQRHSRDLHNPASHL